MAKGKTADALEPLKRAAEINPANANLQEQYARGLIAAQKLPEAYAEYQKLLENNPKLAQGWINLALLANQLGHEAEVVDDWQKAVEANPENANAQLYLAEALDQRGELQAAARHYREYLRIVAAHKDEHKDERATAVSALIKVADADAAAHRDADAVAGYKAAVSDAQKSGQVNLASLAFVHLADAQEKQGDAAGALDSYQRGLELDKKLNEPKTAAVDWFNYGQFLRRQRQPNQLVFACLLQAEQLAGNDSSEEGAAIAQAIREVEASLGKGAAARLRIDHAKELRQTLDLRAGQVRLRQ